MTVSGADAVSAAASAGMAVVHTTARHKIIETKEIRASYFFMLIISSQIDCAITKAIMFL
jgi:hypothetical protein